MPTSINSSGITFPNGTTQTTAASGAGTVTSVATGNGLQGGTITTSGTLSVACPGFNTVGSYVLAGWSQFVSNTGALSTGGTYSAGGGMNQITSTSLRLNDSQWVKGVNLSGTWRWMTIGTGAVDSDLGNIGLACRVS